jgi:hypothetical protein
MHEDVPKRCDPNGTLGIDEVWVVLIDWLRKSAKFLFKFATYVSKRRHYSSNWHVPATQLLD